MSLLRDTANTIGQGRDFVGQQLGVGGEAAPVYEPDFKQGFKIEEIQDGQLLSNETVTLLGNTMPFQPFRFGGEQRINKQYYPGNPEPTVHILGPEETDLVVNGRFKDKKYKSPEARGVAEALQLQLDAIRIRGNLLRITLGEWRRYGYLIGTEFSLKTIADIDYQLTFSIIGFNPPTRCQQVDRSQDVPVAINKNLISRLADFQNEIDSAPDTLEPSIADQINGFANDLSEAVTQVTDFIDGTLQTIEDINQAINRVIGVVRFAQTETLRFKQRVGQIGFADPNVFNGGSSPSTTQQLSNNRYLANITSSSFDIMEFLAQLRRQFLALVATSPLARVRVKSGDTLQSIASTWYGESGEWERIYEHNDLVSTELEIGSVIEVPRL